MAESSVAVYILHPPAWLVSPLMIVCLWSGKLGFESLSRNASPDAGFKDHAASGSRRKTDTEPILSDRVGSNPRIHVASGRAIDRVIFGVLSVTILTLIIGLLVAPRAAQAHEVGRAECRTYEQMHALVSGSRAAAARMGRRCRTAAARHMLTHPLPIELVPPILRRIRDCESGDRLASGRAVPGSHRYGAQNRVSTASGAYQFLDTTWGGHLGYAKARHAPPRVQDQRAIRHWSTYGTAPWNESRGCWS